MTIKFEIIDHKTNDKSSNITPQVSICLKSFSKDNQGNILISPELTSSDFEKYIDFLISDLKKLKRKSNKHFQLKK